METGNGQGACGIADAAKPLGLNVESFDESGLTVDEEGGVTSALGFRAAGVHAGFRADPDRLDFALVAADEACPCAAVFTQNVFCAAPVMVSRDHLDGTSYGMARAVIVNSGNANAATGLIGMESARRSAGLAGDALGCPARKEIGRAHV